MVSTNVLLWRDDSMCWLIRILERFGGCWHHTQAFERSTASVRIGWCAYRIYYFKVDEDKRWAGTVIRDKQISTTGLSFRPWRRITTTVWAAIFQHPLGGVLFRSPECCAPFWTSGATTHNQFSEAIYRATYRSRLGWSPPAIVWFLESRASL